MKLINGIDYYIENGKWVFTEQFLKTRPCCKNGCRHCPYGYKHPDTQIKSIDNKDVNVIEIKQQK